MRIGGDGVVGIVFDFDQPVLGVVAQALVVLRLGAGALFLDQAAVGVVAVGDGLALFAVVLDELVVAVVAPGVGAEEAVGGAVAEAVAEFVVAVGFLRQRAGLVGAGEAVEAVVLVVVVAVFGGFLRDVGFGVTMPGKPRTRGSTGLRG